MSIQWGVLLGLLATAGSLNAETYHVVNAGYVSFAGFASNNSALPMLATDPKHAELDRAYLGLVAKDANRKIREQAQLLAGNRPDVQFVELGSASLEQSEVNPKSIYLWLGTVGNTVALPEFFMFEADERHSQRLTVSFSFYLIHLQSHRVAFNQQAIVVLPCRKELPLLEEEASRLLDGLGKALEADVSAPRRFLNGLRNRNYGEVTNYIYSVSAEDVAVPESFRQVLRPHFGEQRSEESLSDLQRLIALEVSQGVARKGVCLPPIPKSLIDRVQVGDQDASGLWALFHLSASKDLGLPPGAFQNDSKSGRVIISGQFPRPDFTLQVQTNYREDFSAEYGGIRWVYRGHLEMNLDERLGTYSRRLNGARPLTGSADAAYAVTGQPLVRAFCLSLKAAMNLP